MQKYYIGTMVLTLIFLAIGSTILLAQEDSPFPRPEILSLKERAALQDSWALERLETIVPKLMRREGADMWILVAREYNEDPVVMTMLPATSMAARRTTILIFFDGAEGFERLTVSRYGIGEFFESVWDPEEQPNQWARVLEIIKERDPRKIAINMSDDFPLADGLSASLYAQMQRELAGFSGRIEANERLAVGWLETRTDAEMAYYPNLVRLAHGIIAEAFSGSVITPGKTTANDVVWWLRQKTHDMGLGTWFHPSVNIQRREQQAFDIITMWRSEDDAILPGDLLHVDFGITYLGLNTDTQHHGYVLREGETEAPKYLQAGLAAANELQDILISHFDTSLTGNEILAITRAEAIERGLKPSIYTHPLGFQGHGAGATIGMWDNQNDTVGRGDYPIQAHTAWSIELNVTVGIEEWDGQDVRFMLEEDAFFDGNRVRFIDGRQNQFHLIPSQIE